MLWCGHTEVVTSLWIDTPSRPWVSDRRYCDLPTSKQEEVRIGVVVQPPSKTSWEIGSCHNVKTSRPSTNATHSQSRQEVSRHTNDVGISTGPNEYLYLFLSLFLTLSPFRNPPLPLLSIVPGRTFDDSVVCDDTWGRSLRVPPVYTFVSMFSSLLKGLYVIYSCYGDLSPPVRRFSGPGIFLVETPIVLVTLNWVFVTVVLFFHFLILDNSMNNSRSSYTRTITFSHQYSWSILICWSMSLFFTLIVLIKKE